MAESYFELLTERQGLPAKPFDPLKELKHLRRRLALRIQNCEQFGKIDLPPFQEEVKSQNASLPESISPESVLKQVLGMKTTLAIWQRSRLRIRSQRGSMFRGHQRLWNKKRLPSLVIQYLNTPQEGMLETVNAVLTALGMIGIVFGILSFYRGWESGLSPGSLICATGAAVVAIGLGGHFLAAFTEPA